MEDEERDGNQNLFVEPFFLITHSFVDENVPFFFLSCERNETKSVFHGVLVAFRTRNVKENEDISILNHIVL